MNTFHPVACKRLLEDSEQLTNLRHELASTLMQICTELRHKRVCEPKLRNSKAGNGELTQTEQPDSELRYRDDTARELPNRDDSSRRHRHTVRPILE
jgi:hypothetical protein